jgi:hypothetical protein
MVLAGASPAKEQSMADRSNLADTLRPFIEGMEDPAKRSDMEEAIDLMRDLDIEIVPAEFANKGVPKMRKATREGISFVIADRGRVKSLKEAEIVMTIDRFVGLMGRIYESGERHAATRRPAGAVLAQLEPTHPDLASMRVSLREHEETKGGRRRLF